MWSTYVHGGHRYIELQVLYYYLFSVTHLFYSFLHSSEIIRICCFILPPIISLVIQQWEHASSTLCYMLLKTVMQLKLSWTPKGSTNQKTVCQYPLKLHIWLNNCTCVYPKINIYICLAKVHVYSTVVCVWHVWDLSMCINKALPGRPHRKAALPRPDLRDSPCTEVPRWNCSEDCPCRPHPHRAAFLAQVPSFGGFFFPGFPTESFWKPPLQGEEGNFVFSLQTQ